MNHSHKRLEEHLTQRHSFFSLHFTWISISLFFQDYQERNTFLLLLKAHSAICSRLHLLSCLPHRHTAFVTHCDHDYFFTPDNESTTLETLVFPSCGRCDINIPSSEWRAVQKSIVPVSEHIGHLSGNNWTESLWIVSVPASSDSEG
jgi:hypothetical protein